MLGVGHRRRSRSRSRKSVAFVSASILMAHGRKGDLRRCSRGLRASDLMTWPQRLLSVAFVTTGILHFVRTGTYEQIVPDYLPAHHEIVLLSGAAEIAGGVGVAFGRTRAIAGVWLVALLVVVFPANLNMAVNSERFGSIAPALLWARLPLQGALIWWAWRATRPRASERSVAHPAASEP
jgi:uncharacterized membrane protein